MILIPIPSYGFDPTEVAIPWSFLKYKKEKITFATPDGLIARGDSRLLTGKGFGPLKKMLMADNTAIVQYNKMVNSNEFQQPISYKEIKNNEFEAIILPGGHDPGMKSYLESKVLQKEIAAFFELKKPIGAICHGAVLAARTLDKEKQKSVLYSYNTTALLSSQELLAYYLTCLWLKNYYRTYPMTVQQEVTSSLRESSQFQTGRLTFKRDSNENTKHAFVVEDRNYVSARWPGDAHLFAQTFYKILIEWRSKSSYKIS